MVQPSDFQALFKAFKAGEVMTASRKDLERYAMMICRPEAGTHFPGHMWPQVADTIRLLLLVRISEETQTQALAIAKVALWISVLAAMFTGVSTLAQLGIIQGGVSPQTPQAQTQPQMQKQETEKNKSNAKSISGH